MRRLPFPMILRWAVLTGYALLVALGHAGWHVVVDQDSCPAHGSHAGLTESQVEAGHTHTTCSHGHVHKHSAKHSHNAHQHGTHGHTSPCQPAPTHHEHDPDHCSVCAVFSAPQTLALAVELVLVAGEINSEVELQALFVPASQELLPAPRGPPAC